MKQPLTVSEARSRAEALCSRSEYSDGQIAHKLQQWGIGSQDTASIIDHLINEHYINNARFARAFALDKLRYNAWGRIKIQQALHLAGVCEADIRAAFDEIPKEEYRQVLRTVIDRKARQLKGEEDDYTRRGKLIRHALSHGFEMELVMDEV